MATLTIADLDNGKIDLETIEGVANSHATQVNTRYGGPVTTLHETIRRINSEGDSQLAAQNDHANEVISNLGFRVPVGYSSGLEIIDSRVTVRGPDGIIYAPLNAPFVTDTWNPAQWYVLQNDLNDHKLLVFNTFSEAEAAAATLPDGQLVDVVAEDNQYRVSAGALVFVKNLDQLELDLAAQSGASKVTTSAIGGVVDRDLESVLRDSVSILSFGADRIGLLDSGPAFQLVHDALASQGVTVAEVEVPFGVYWLNTPVVFDSVAITFVGCGFNIGPGIQNGTWLKIDNPEISPFRITGAQARGTGFRNIALFQSHPAQGPNWEPTNYPFVFDCVDLFGEFILDNIYAPNCNKLVSSVNSGRLVVNRIKGQFFSEAISLDKTYDCPRIVDIHNWPYWSSHPDVLRYSQDNCDLIRMGRVDTPFVDKIFSYASRSTIRCVTTESGYTTKLLGGEIACDFGRYALWIESPEFTAQISTLNTQHENVSGGGVPVYAGYPIFVTGANARFRVATMHTARTSHEAISVQSPGCAVDIGSAMFDWINQSGGVGAAHVAAGSSVNFASTPTIVNSGVCPITAPGSPASATAVLSQEIPGGAVNFVQAYASSGSTVAVGPIGSAADIDMNVSGKGAGSGVRLVANGRYCLRVDNPNGAASSVLVRPNDGGVNHIVEGVADNLDYQLSPKGQGLVQLGGAVFVAAPDASISGWAWVKDAEGIPRKMLFAS